MSILFKVINRNKKRENKLLDSNNIFFGKIAIWPGCLVFFNENQYVKSSNYVALEKVSNGFRVIGDDKNTIYDVYSSNNICKIIVTSLHPISELFEDVNIKLTEKEILNNLKYVDEITELLNIDSTKQIKR